MTESIIVNTNRKLSTISRDIYGHFSEHLGRCIYGGFWVGKKSPIDNIHGYRKDVITAFKELAIPNLRWPGGCFADEYHWKDGIGPYENRKRMINTNWGGVVEDNSFGTHEFMGLCDELGCKPYICGNVGSGTVQEMDEWIEYMTFSGESPMSRLRELNGCKNAWKIPFFGIGNENWGCGGNMRPEYYADLYRRFQTYVRQYGEDKIYKIAGGANGDDYNWTEVLMREAGKFMDGLSLHYYTIENDWNNKRPATEFEDLGWYQIIQNSFRMDELLRRHDEIMSHYDPQKRVGLVVDEWGCWHKNDPGTNPGFLYQQNTMRDAVSAGIILNIFNSHSDRVRIANLAQAVNVLQAPVLTEGDKLVKTPTWHVLQMYKQHQGAVLLETSAAYVSTGCTGDNENEQVSVPGLSVSASLRSATDTENQYTVTICNPDLYKTKNVDISFAGITAPITRVEGRVLESEQMNSCNTFENPEAITQKTLAIQIITADSLLVHLPARSVAVISAYV